VKIVAKIERIGSAVFARIERIGSWAGRLWADYWLLISGSFFVFGSVVLKWVEYPFSRNLRGLQLPLFRDIALMPHLTLLSFGMLAALVLLAGLLFLRRSAGLLAGAAAILLTIFALVPAHIAFERPALLQRLAEESQVMPLINAFAKDYLPQNYGAPEVIPKRLILYSGWGRFVAAWSFLRLGWYFFGLGSLLVAFYVLRRLTGQRAFPALAIFGLPVAALAIVLAPAMVGQHLFTKGALAKAEGRNLDAIEDFRRSMRWDSWHARDIDLYGMIGELQRASGIAEDSPERHINRALELEQASNYQQAVFELEGAAKAGGELGDTARRAAARAQFSLGLALYRAGGVGAAVTHWQEGLALDPMQVYSLPYLARGYFTLGSYNSSVQMVDEVVKIVKDHNSLVADAYSVGADAYAKLGQDGKAREYYNLSLTVDPVQNYWALTGLVGE
jgi:tetratricopeptide (TPR) repeat protein